MSTTYRTDYPSVPIGGDNPYYCCADCGVSDPEINGRLEGHRSFCSWAIRQRVTPLTLAKLASKSIDCGAVQRLSLTLTYNAVFFLVEEDRDAFAELIQEEFPNEQFRKDKLGQDFILQLKK